MPIIEMAPRANPFQYAVKVAEGADLQNCLFFADIDHYRRALIRMTLRTSDFRNKDFFLHHTIQSISAVHTTS